MSFTFTKLFSSITESTVWCEPDRTRLVWICMLAMADRHGRVMASIPGLANRSRVPVEDARLAIETFLSPDRDSRTPDNEGRRIEPIDGGWRLLNHEKYRSIRDEETIKESKRNYINNRRAKERASVENVEPESNSVDRSRANAEAYTEAEAEKKEDKKTSRKRESSPTCPDDVVEQVWKDWLQLRKGKRAAVTETVISGARAEAAKAGLGFEDFLSIWCRRGSQGLEADWIKPHERPSSQPSGETAYQRSMRERMQQVVPGIAAKAPGVQNTFEMEAHDVTTRRLG